MQQRRVDDLVHINFCPIAKVEEIRQSIDRPGFGIVHGNIHKRIVGVFSKHRFPSIRALIIGELAGYPVIAPLFVGFEFERTHFVLSFNRLQDCNQRGTP
jgi:hypothetical protein